MNFKSIFAALLQGAANGAVQGLSTEPDSNAVNWKGVGIVAAFGALVALSTALAQHPAVVAATPKPAPVA